MKFSGRNVSVSPKAYVGSKVRIGDNSTIYDNVVIEANSTIANDCVIGEPLVGYYSEPDSYDHPPTFIGKHALIRSHSIIYAGSTLGDGFSCGHRVTIREGSHFGIHCRVGTLSDVQGSIQFGDYCWLHSGVFVAQGTRLGNFVFAYPHVVFTDDLTPPSSECRAPSVGDFSQIGAQSVVLPGVHIGRHCIVAAGSVVSKDVEDFTMVLGSPARAVKAVSEVLSPVTGKAHYPWPQYFDRGMPWQGMDFWKWLGANEQYRF